MSLEDERVRFYFRHRKQIEEWAALRGDAVRAVDGWLVQLSADMQELFRSLGSERVRLEASLGEPNYPNFRLVDGGWASLTDSTISVSLEWVRGKTNLLGTAMPYVGLRAPKNAAFGAALRADPEISKARALRKELTSAWWVAYNYVTPPEDFPNSDAAYREAIIEAVRSAWNTYAPLIETALAREGAQQAIG